MYEKVSAKDQWKVTLWAWRNDEMLWSWTLSPKEKKVIIPKAIMNIGHDRLLLAISKPWFDYMCEYKKYVSWINDDKLTFYTQTIQMHIMPKCNIHDLDIFAKFQSCNHVTRLMATWQLMIINQLWMILNIVIFHMNHKTKFNPTSCHWPFFPWKPILEYIHTTCVSN